MKKRVVSLLLALPLTLCALPALADAGQRAEILTYQDIQVVVNGESVPVQDMEPFILNGRVYIPADLAPNARWDEAANTVYFEEMAQIAVPAGEDATRAVSFRCKRSGLIKADGSLWTWGENYLGNGEEGGSGTPVHIMGDVASISMGNGTSLAIRKDGSLWAWGDNQEYTVGNGQDRGKQLTPVKILEDVVRASAGYETAAAVTADGGLYLWGSNRDGNLAADMLKGGPAKYMTPTRVMEGVADVSCNAYDRDAYVLALKQDGTVWSWGFNSYGQLGDGQTDLQAQLYVLDGGNYGRPRYDWQPRQILEGVIAIDAGSAFAAALKADGTLWTWGRDEKGCLGNGGITNAVGIYNKPCQSIPMQILDGVTAVRLGAYHGLALKTDGTLWAWGDRYGNVPVQLPIEGVVAFGAGFNSSIAVKADGTVWAWAVWNDPAQIPDITR